MYNFILLQVKTNIKAELSRMPPKSLNIMLDIWTSSQKVSVIGFTAQYEKDWKICQSTLGFKEFSESHTAANIKNRVEEYLFSELGLKEEQVVTV